MSIPNEFRPVKGAVTELPAGYRRVKALRCAASDAYIYHTGVVNTFGKGSYVEWFSSFDHTFKFVLDIQYFTTANYQRNGCYAPGDSVQFGMNSGAAEFISVIIPPDGNRVPITSDLRRHEVVLDVYGGKMTVDGVLQSSFARQEHTWDWGFLLGACSHKENGEISVGTPCAEDIYTCCAYKEGKLCSKLVPCIDKDGRPCFYDTVRRLALYNKGENEFEVIQ